MTYYKIKAVNKKTKEVKWLDTFGAISFSKGTDYIPSKMLTTDKTNIALVSCEGIAELIIMAYTTDAERDYTIEKEDR